MTPALDTDGRVVYVGRVILTWPSIRDMSHPTCMIVTDADSGAQITSVRKAVVTADCDAPGIVADLTILCDLDGTPLLEPGAPLRLQADGTPREETFRVLVAEMRVTGGRSAETAGLLDEDQARELYGHPSAANNRTR